MLIQTMDDVATPLVTELVKAVYKAKGNPFVYLENAKVQRALLMNGNEEQIKIRTENLYSLLKKMQCSIIIRDFRNASELADVPEEIIKLQSKVCLLYTSC